jgi:hypothetical protein
MIALVFMSPIAVLTAFGAVVTYIVVDGVSQNRNDPAQPRPISDRVRRRRQAAK